MLDMNDHHTSTRGSDLIVSGLRRLLLHSVFVYGAGMLAGYVVGLMVGSTGAWLIWGTTLIATLLTYVTGAARVIDGAAILAPLAERAWRTNAAAVERQAREALAPQEDAEAKAAAEAERIRARQEAHKALLERFGGQDPVAALLADAQVGEKARNLRRIYGRGVAASFLNDTARELGLGDGPITEDDLPANF